MRGYSRFLSQQYLLLHALSPAAQRMDNVALTKVENP